MALYVPIGSCSKLALKIVLNVWLLMNCCGGQEAIKMGGCFINKKAFQIISERLWFFE